jgi:hypothetical protein
MNGEKFAEIVDLQFRLCTDVLVDKAREYAPDDDRLHNFRVAAALQDVDLLEACAGMMAKHTVSVYDMCGSTEKFSIAQWSEKITDSINYLVILRAIVQEMKDAEGDVDGPQLSDKDGVNPSVMIFDEMQAFEDLGKVLRRVFGLANVTKENKDA